MKLLITDMHLVNDKLYKLPVPHCVYPDTSENLVLSATYLPQLEEYFESVSIYFVRTNFMYNFTLDKRFQINNSTRSACTNDPVIWMNSIKESIYQSIAATGHFCLDENIITLFVNLYMLEWRALIQSPLVENPEMCRYMCDTDERDDKCCPILDLNSLKLPQPRAQITRTQILKEFKDRQHPLMYDTCVLNKQNLFIRPINTLADLLRDIPERSIIYEAHVHRPVNNLGIYVSGRGIMNDYLLDLNNGTEVKQALRDLLYEGIPMSQ